MSDKLLLRNIQFYGYHGAPPAERAVGHRFSVDLELELNLQTAGRSDRLDDTVDYGAIAATVIEIGTGPSIKLVEALSERMAAAILAGWPAVDAVTVETRKLMPPISAVVESAAVRIRRERQAD